MQLVLHSECETFRNGDLTQNASVSGSLLQQIIRGCSQTNDSSFPVYVDIVDTNQATLGAETHSGAVMYIVAVLVFYSAGIIVMIVKYLRREKQELEEERILDDFFRSMPRFKKEREQNKMNKVAIHAFHALTSYSEATEELCLGSSDEETSLNHATDTRTERKNTHHAQTCDTVSECQNNETLCDDPDTRTAVKLDKCTLSEENSNHETQL